MVRDEARQRLLEAATGYFGSREEAEEWMNSPHLGLEGMTPAQMLESGPSIEQLGELIHQLEQGDTP